MRVATFVYQFLTALVLSSTTTVAMDEVSIISRNLYLGADFTVLFNPTNVNQSIHEVVQNFYSLVESTDYPSRANVLAQEILDRTPDVVCLQEVFTYGFSDNINGTDASIDIDFLGLLLEELGSDYGTASAVHTTNTIFPYEVAGDTGEDDTFLVIQDSDVILTRNDMIVVDSSNDLFSTVLSIPIVSSASEGPILEVKRGYSSIKIDVSGKVVLIANTHLDGSSFLPFQTQQAREFVAAVDSLSESNDTAATILVGDFNAVPMDPLPTDCTTANDTYSILSCGRVDPFAEANEPTYGTDAALLELTSPLIRIDHVFTTSSLAVVETEVFGKEPNMEDLAGMYPSDHFGLSCILSFPDVEGDEEGSADNAQALPLEDSSDENNSGN